MRYVSLADDFVNNTSFAKHMTLRDYFAAMAMQELLCRPRSSWPDGIDASKGIADAAYYVANVMIEARKVKP